MKLYCAHCKRQCPREDFVIRRYDNRMLYTGHRVISALHNLCHKETEWPDSALTQRDRLAPAR